MEKFIQSSKPESDKKASGGYEDYEEAVQKTKDLVASSETEEELKQKLTDAGIWFGHINWIGQGDDRYEENKETWGKSEKDGSLEFISFNNYKLKSGAFVYVQLDPDFHF